MHMNQSLKNFDFKFSQCFGDKTDIITADADIITSVEFDYSGDYLATGDKGGRVVLFERNHDSKNAKRTCEYKFFTEFQSHDAEFDYLKSVEIEEKINQIKWLNSTTQRSKFLISTNDKTIKLWKITEKNVTMVNENNLEGVATNISPLNSINQLKLPSLTYHDKIISATPKRVFGNAHTYHINSISPNSDQETFISADDLRINLWNYDHPDQSFNIIDIKPMNMEELTEVITCAEFHPQDCNLFMYSLSKGLIKLCDMRQNSLCHDNKAKIFEEYIDPINHNFFTEITSSISDIKFSPNGRYIASRDYLTVKIWDINMDNEPIKTINVQEQLKERLSDTYENDAIFDRFEVVFSGDSSSVMTGSYNNNFMIYPNAIKTNDLDTDMIVQPFNSSKNNSNSNNNNNNQKIKTKKDGTILMTDTGATIPRTSLRNKRNNNNNNNDNNNNVDGDDAMMMDDGFEGDLNDDDEEELDEIVLQANKLAFRNKGFGSLAQRSARNKEWGDNVDFKKSIMHFSWHPRENTIAVGATNNLFMFSSI
ncbi:protein phosphatase 2A regulatory subunit CDC55 NDAI_0B02680 [Naumovozyma dairenensis CBS 421]|uniref:Protein phosphatase PP2A regulatory subunit B n=1 Tax=Naumovozyma dairenensis (strain ATCC 10597 / BCRC 20456 / CBS 421 / NBRC 0211 / NRRL Y-12639) TaxID=1071378 RepID=G0W692_NAUDC|nr:hypothetical protein NDAI_0B02680 [Naumovozyma dairenensis CBS 421]CCD23303.1 hypothetical protein NDAI_0B02680 [Naumovozyma dairenensis CBS 421]